MGTPAVVDRLLAADRTIAEHADFKELRALVDASEALAAALGAAPAAPPRSSRVTGNPRHPRRRSLPPAGATSTARSRHAAKRSPTR